MKGLIKINNKKSYIWCFLLTLVIVLVLSVFNISPVIEKYINFDINIVLYLVLIIELNAIIRPVNIFK